MKAKLYCTSVLSMMNEGCDITFQLLDDRRDADKIEIKIHDPRPAAISDFKVGRAYWMDLTLEEASE